MNHHRHLQDVTEDQLTLASIHYLRSHYQEAIDIYKRVLLEHRYVARAGCSRRVVSCFAGAVPQRAAGGRLDFVFIRAVGPGRAHASLEWRAWQADRESAAAR